MAVSREFSFQARASQEGDAPAAEYPWNNRRSSEQPKQRIFLSIDCIDSTKLKKNLIDEKSGNHVWAKIFQKVLSEAVITYCRKHKEIIEKYCSGSCDKLSICNELCEPKLKLKELEWKNSDYNVSVWKYIGDEVVLTADLNCEKQASLHVLALAETINFINKGNDEAKIGKTGKKKSKFPTHFKGAAWVAEFPVANVEVYFPAPSDVRKSDRRTYYDRRAKGREIKDFLGRSMDLGFTIAKKANEDRLIISAELAYLIIISNYYGDKTPYLPLYHGGEGEEKSGFHPQIWYYNSNLSDDGNGHVPIPYEKLKNFLETKDFIKTENPPFIPSNGVFTEYYRKRYEEAAEKQKYIRGPFFRVDKKPAATSKKSSLEDPKQDAEKFFITLGGI